MFAINSCPQCVGQSSWFDIHNKGMFVPDIFLKSIIIKLFLVNMHVIICRTYVDHAFKV